MGTKCQIRSTSGASTLSADVAVIGAGIIGVTIAYYLQSEGRSVLLIDRKGVAQEASRGNAGAFAFSDILPLPSPGMILKAARWLTDPVGPLAIPPAYLPEIAPWLFRFWRASRPGPFRQSVLAQSNLMALAATEMEALANCAGLLSFIRKDGSLELYETDAEFEAALPGWLARERAGIAFEHVRGERLAELQPGLSPHFQGGTYVPSWQTVTDPFDFASAIYERAAERGTRFLIGEVEAIDIQPASLRLRLKDGACLEAAHAVIASGAWSRRLAMSLGDRIPLETERGYNTTLPVDAFPLKRQLIFGGHGFVITPLATGIRVGGAVELGGLKRPPNYARSKAMLAKAARFLPGLRTGGGTEWMGFRPSLPDSLPVIGRSRASPRVVYAFGHGHLGLTQSAATARLVVDLMADRPASLDLYPFRPSRF